MFLRDVLLSKGFDPSFVHRIMHLVAGGHTAVCVNGSVGQYFHNGRGLLQGDPLSPLLFNFGVDAISSILDDACAAGHIVGVATHLLPAGVSHFQYADDMVIVIDKNDLHLANLKFLLLCFEALLGLKINLLKSEIIVLGCDQNDKYRVANLMNCKLGSFPMTYLGIPIADRKLLASDFVLVVNKVGQRVHPWRGKFNTSAGKVILINSCLSSIPLFCMSMYCLSDGTHEGFDKHRSSFFWSSHDNKKKYRLVKWKTICKPKDIGGLGITNASIMNKCLLLKWWWKICQPSCGDARWSQILKAKCFLDNEPVFSSARNNSQFWKALIKIRMNFDPLLNSRFGLDPQLDFGWIGGLGMAHLRTSSLPYFLTVVTLKCVSLSFMPPIGTSGFGVH